MNLSGFCRNCLSRWYGEAAAEQGVDISKDAAREIVYGMPYAEWKAKHQTEATDAQKADFDGAAKDHSYKGEIGGCGSGVGLVNVRALSPYHFNQKEADHGADRRRCPRSTQIYR